MTPYLKNYFSKVPEAQRTSEGISYAAALETIQKTSPHIAQLIVKELQDQRSYLKLIASENFCSLPVQMAMGNLLTDKYAEGFPFHRFYAGCDNVDHLEQIATDELKNLFEADHAYVQPHSGADANLVAFWSVLVHRVQHPAIEALGKKTVDELTPAEYETIRKLMMSQKVMGMSLRSGGHLTHGFRHNISSKMMQSVSYDVDPITGLIDYKALQQLVKEEKPTILIGGYSAYPRLIDFALLREIADSVKATLIVDMAHFAGLVAGKVCTGNYNPIPFAHIVTSTTHKTLRGPRGGLILCQKQYKDVVDKGCPLVLGGPLPHVIAAKALAFKEANTPEFRVYANQIVANANRLAQELLKANVHVTTGGTDNHLLIFDVKKSFGLTGRQAESALREGMLTVNRNMVPFDDEGAWYTSGIRIGPAALTTLGMKEGEMELIASWIVKLLKGSAPDFDSKTGGMSRAKVTVNPLVLQTVREEMGHLMKRFPLYPEVIID
ncbi:MAG: glycine hydroxymethyltransferase [Candidatus Rhabdochlamydia sp.]